MAGYPPIHYGASFIHVSIKVMCCCLLISTCTGVKKSCFFWVQRKQTWGWAERSVMYGVIGQMFSVIRMVKWIA